MVAKQVQAPDNLGADCEAGCHKALRDRHSMQRPEHHMDE
jgi:hypothetical protein